MELRFGTSTPIRGSEFRAGELALSRFKFLFRLGGTAGTAGAAGKTDCCRPAGQRPYGLHRCQLRGEEVRDYHPEPMSPTRRRCVQS
jgi:hypothetical protein